MVGQDELGGCQRRYVCGGWIDECGQGTSGCAGSYHGWVAWALAWPGAPLQRRRRTGTERAADGASGVSEPRVGCERCERGVVRGASLRLPLSTTTTDQIPSLSLCLSIYHHSACCLLFVTHSPFHLSTSFPRPTTSCDFLSVLPGERRTTQRSAASDADGLS